MSDHIVNEALRVSQEFELKVFPCNADKKPMCGWKDDATSDPEKIKKLFIGASLVGVPCGEANDLFVLDLDTYKAEEGDAVLDFEEEVRAADTRIHRTKSGGLHAIFLNPVGRKWHRQPMAHCEAIGEGFYFIWPTEGSGYVVEDDVALDLLDEPSDDLLRQREKLTGATTGKLMTSEEADVCMRSDGKTASRHEAILRMAHDFVQAVPVENLNMEWMTSAFIALFKEDYGDLVSPDRMEELLEARQDHHGDWHGELVRALAYPLKLRQAERGTERMVELLKDRGEVSVIEAPIIQMKSEPEALTGSYFTKFEDEDEDTKPWLIQNFMRVEGNGAIIGQSGVGKTTLTAMWVAAFIAGKSEVAGFPSIDRPLNIAWMNAEEEAADLRQHVREAQKELGLSSIGRLITMGEEILDKHEEGISLVIKKRDPDLHFTDLVVNMPLVNKIAAEVREAGIDLLIADPITEFNDGNENDRSDAKKLNRAFKLIAQKAGVAVLYWAHTGKPPEGKRPDWHVNDQFSQRGSSQNIGAVKTSGTLTPVMPAGKAEEAQQYYAQARDHDRYPDIPNIVRLKLLKVKKCPARLELFYDLRPSSRDRDIPVAHLISGMDARNMTAEAEDKDKRMRAAQIGAVLVKKLGEGTHNRPDVNMRLKGVELPGGVVWTGAVKASTPKWEAILRLFVEPVKVGGKYISAAFEEGSAGFTITVQA